MSASGRKSRLSSVAAAHGAGADPLEAEHAAHRLLQCAGDRDGHLVGLEGAALGETTIRG